MKWNDTVIHIEDLNEQRLPRTYEEMKAELGKQAEASCKAGMRKEDLEIRRALWASHPCEGKYADDGEFQCGYYLPIIDFLRDDWETLGRRIARHTQAMLREQQRGFRDEVEKLGVIPDDALAAELGKIREGLLYRDVQPYEILQVQLAHDKENLLKKLEGK